MNRITLLVLLLGASITFRAQTVVAPYNPDINNDQLIGVADLFGFLGAFDGPFIPGDVMIDGQSLTEYIAILEEAAANASTDTVTIPLPPGSQAGEMLYWDGAEWSLVPAGNVGEGLILGSDAPGWAKLRTGCTDVNFLEFDEGANVDDGSCTTAVVFGCTDPDYAEFDFNANVDDGSCSVLASTLCVSVNYDGHDYAVAWIGGQCWFAENLRTTVYANGDAIPMDMDDATWDATEEGAAALYGEGSSFCADQSPDFDGCDENAALAGYGRLYNFHACVDERGLCPTGWHVPTNQEWTDLEAFMDSDGYEGLGAVALKATSGWYDNGNGSDVYGFAALPSGARLLDGGFVNAGGYGYWWASTMFDENMAWCRNMSFSGNTLDPFFDLPGFGFGVRCIQD